MKKRNKDFQKNYNKSRDALKIATLTKMLRASLCIPKIIEIRL